MATQTEGQEQVKTLTKLEALMRDTTADEKKQLMADMGISERSWFQRCNRPGMLSGPELIVLHTFFEKKYGKDINVAELYQAAA